MGKRGRKPGSGNKNYFCKEQEMAVVEYLATDSKAEKNRIFNEKLRIPFKKMVESIIRRYKLYVPDETYDDTFYDALSFLVTKMDKFNPDKNRKAYSYYGTICKNHLIGRIEKYNKEMQRKDSYDKTIGTFNDNIKYSDYGEDKIASDTIKNLIPKVEYMIKNPEEYELRDTEIKLGKALKILLENWDEVLSTDGSRKLNKSAVLWFLKESTGFDTKGIRENMQKFKSEFYDVKKILLSMS